MSSSEAASAPVCEDDWVGGFGEDPYFLERIQERAFQRTIPFNVMLELTLDCNIRCQHCYNFDRDQPRRKSLPVVARDRQPARAPLSLADVSRLLGDLRAAGTLFLGLTGGEVLSYPHLFEVLDRTRELGFAVQLLTNGTLLRPRTVSRLAGYRNLLGLSISLYGASPEVHDAITQVKGSWRRTWDGIERARAAGIAVRLKFIVMRGNAHEVTAMRVQGDAGAYAYQVDLTITARHDGTDGSLATRVDDQQLLSLHQGPLRDMISNVPRVMNAEINPCNCARGACAVLSNGDVTPCISVPWVAGNVRDQSFIDIWRDSPVFQQIRGLKTSDYATCAPCADRPYCARPRGAAFTASGSYTGVDPFVCKTAAAKRRALTEAPAASLATTSRG